MVQSLRKQHFSSGLETIGISPTEAGFRGFLLPKHGGNTHARGHRGGRYHKSPTFLWSAAEQECHFMRSCHSCTLSLHRGITGGIAGKCPSTSSTGNCFSRRLRGLENPICVRLSCHISYFCRVRGDVSKEVWGFGLNHLCSSAIIMYATRMADAIKNETRVQYSWF